MPFPLAHPAAVLPFRRPRFRWLSFPALVIGSVVPDAGYMAPNLDALSHGFWGGMLFGLPVGAVILAAFYALRTPLVSMLPRNVKQALLPICKRPIGPLWAIAVSLLIGIWTHLLWDGFTHKDGFIVQHLPVLLTPVMTLDGHTAKISNLLWYVSSFLGTGWLFLVFEKWKQNVLVDKTAGGIGRNIVQDAAFVAILVIPVSLIHHLIPTPFGYLMTAGFSLCLGFLFLTKSG